ncbi:topoisomerase DNA-binding C4 zinc finger domain-containing protein [Pseudogemmobacter bohemicus]|uniref:topoisomerase DNA-binding C4 zinc finger domain-containing protein n=1 Tax=Pseudogemmobacter bohemicus TaxID=2250708 RepID=UPI002FCDB427
MVLLGADAGRVGFPSEITDDPLLSLVSPEAEPFENAEERRVMYVAMTRARSTLTIMASRSRPSTFVSELLADPEYGLQDSLAGTTALPPCSKCGGQLVPVQSQAGRVWYHCQHDRHCGNMLPACPDCETGLPQRTADENHGCGSCEATFQSCPVCGDGWLVPRKGRYGSFPGCVRYPDCSGKAKPERPNGGRRRKKSDQAQGPSGRRNFSAPPWHSSRMMLSKT